MGLAGECYFLAQEQVKLGFSLLSSPPNQESRQLRRLNASRSDQLGHEVKT